MSGIFTTGEERTIGGASFCFAKRGRRKKRTPSASISGMAATGDKRASIAADEDSIVQIFLQVFYVLVLMLILILVLLRRSSTCIM
mmetsp:Transcript_15100/g.19143  ORF Transcript_15100/g.19143 Transcript_15100/m.19143 type:complete len:86 (+) Transcript_15100:1449-1706(+)